MDFYHTWPLISDDVLHCECKTFSAAAWQKLVPPAVFHCKYRGVDEGTAEIEEGATWGGHQLPSSISPLPLHTPLHRRQVLVPGRWVDDNRKALAGHQGAVRHRSVWPVPFQAALRLQGQLNSRNVRAQRAASIHARQGHPSRRWGEWICSWGLAVVPTVYCSHSELFDSRSCVRSDR